MLSAEIHLKDILVNKSLSVLQFSKESIQPLLLLQSNFLNLYKLPDKVAPENFLLISNGNR